MAYSECAKEAIWLRGLLVEFADGLANIGGSHRVPIEVDNQEAHPTILVSNYPNPLGSSDLSQILHIELTPQLADHTLNL